MNFEIDFLSKDKKVILFKNIFNNINSIILELEKCDWKFWGRDNNDPDSQLGYSTSMTENDGLRKHLVETTQKCVEEYFIINGKDIKDYVFHNNDFHVRKWIFPMKGMPPHTDYTYSPAGEKASVSFTVCGYFNDDYEGGEFMLPEHNWQQKPPAGSLIIFPSHTVHGVTDLLDQHRYMWTTFVYSIEELAKARY